MVLGSCTRNTRSGRLVSASLPISHFHLRECSHCRHSLISRENTVFSPFSLDKCFLPVFPESKTVYSPAFNSGTWFSILSPGCCQRWLESKATVGNTPLHRTVVIVSKVCLKVLLLFSCSVVSDSLWPWWLQHTRPPCPAPSSGACSNSCPSSQWCHPTISSCRPLASCRQSFQHQGPLWWVGSSHQLAKYWSFSPSIWKCSESLR